MDRAFRFISSNEEEHEGVNSSTFHFPVSIGHEADPISDLPSFDPTFSGPMNLQSLFTLNPPALFYNYFPEPLPLTHNPTSYLSSSFTPFHGSLSFSPDYSLKIPKIEPYYPGPYPEAFSHLPELRSLEHSFSPLTPSSSSSSSSRKRALLDSELMNTQPPVQTLDPVQYHGFLTGPYEYKQSPPPPPTIRPIPQSSLARQRRHKLTDKYRCLQKLLPCDKKMEIASMLEETHKYISFLQAQLVSLHFMPTHSAGFPPTPPTRLSARDLELGCGLERLSRNQLLQVLINSPVAQTVLYSQGCCVFSAEQLGNLRNSIERRVEQSNQCPNNYRKFPSTSSFHGC